MPGNNADQVFAEELLAKVRAGLIEGVRLEVERRKKLNLPILVARNGEIVDLTHDTRTIGGGLGR